MKNILEQIDKKKLIILIGAFIFGMLILLGIALLYNKVFSKKTYEEVEQTMKLAAINYFKDNQNELPSDGSERITIKDTELVNNNLMKSVNDQLKAKSYTCDGKVIVTNINGNYRYNPILDCGDEYQTTTLVDYLDSYEPIVTDGNGLYEINNELVYRGDNVNNYLKLGNKVYRIVKITNEHVVIILTDESESIKWDDRYNIDKKSNVGINDYTVSRMRDYLETLYNGNSLLTDSAKLLIDKYSLKIGARSINDVNKSGELEKAIPLENQYIGLLPVYDFLNASIDENCTSTTAKSCANYNYLAKYKKTWWTTTANKDNSYSAFRIANGSVEIANTNKKAYLRPVLYLVSDAIYKSGNGTSTNPYIVK